MAIRIRCQDCKKKISIDEAFAGGMCRCPYCKALVHVDEVAPGGKSAVVRPSEPTARPGAPGMAATQSAATADAEHVPMASKVKIQGIITIILLALLVIMVGGGIAVAVLVIPSRPSGPPPDDRPKTYRVGQNETPSPKAGPVVTDIKITSPVIYVIDGGSGMRGGVFGAAWIEVIRSIKSLNGGKFNIIVARETEDKVILSDMTAGNAEAAEKAKTELEQIFPSGASNLESALKAALAKKPKTIVLFTQKPLYTAAGIAATAKAQGTVIDSIAIEGFNDTDLKSTMKELTGPTGGVSRNINP